MLFIKDGYKIRITAITEVGSLSKSLPNWPGLILNSSLYVKKFPFLIFISKFILGFWFYWWIFCFLEGRGVGCWEIEAQKVSEFDWLLLWWRWEAVGGWIHAKWYPFKASVSLYVPSCIICNFFYIFIHLSFPWLFSLLMFIEFVWNSNVIFLKWVG
jgi:hypothetical protein